ncbi:MAG: hypothetical protein OHK0039_43960 [Bacteroidia bacterium]
MDHITLKITLEEANLILEALGDMPFRKVFELIGKIQAQASQQLQDPQDNPHPPQQR